MTGAESGPRKYRTHLLVFAFAVAFYWLAASLGAQAAGIPLSALAVYYDGLFYLEIAKSFPLPYSAEGPDYMGQAPLYPAFIYATRLAIPSGVANWGSAALIASWVCSGLATVAFYEVCRVSASRPLWAAAFFAVANPRWVTIASTAHSESAAMLFATLSLLAYLRGRLPWCVALLALAALSRFPAILLGLPLAWGWLFERGRRDLGSVVLLGLPIAVLGLFNLYLFSLDPAFQGIRAAHAVFWDPGFEWPFVELVSTLSSGEQPLFQLLMIYGTLVVYLGSIAVGLRGGDRGFVLPLWVATIVLFHVSLSGMWDFARLVVLAWPAALLILWRAFAGRLHALAALLLCVGLGLSGLSVARKISPGAVRMQTTKWYIRSELRLLETDEPSWVDFRRGVPRPTREDVPR